MNKEYFLKIIIPNYNNFIYIKKCLDSILNQSFKDWFCIIVDDMSTDKSDEIADIYQNRYPNNFKLIRMNRKVYAGGCRNMGLKSGVKSKYTYFIDSDDYLYDNNSLQRIYDASKNDPDLIECGLIKMQDNKYLQVKVPSDPRGILFSGPGPCKHCINSKFDKIEFIENRSKCNDVVWGIRVFDSIDDNKISFTNGPVYLYRVDSITSCHHGKNIKNNINSFDAQRKLIDDLDAEIFKKSYCNEVKYSMQSRYREICKPFSKRICIDEAFQNSFVISIDQQRLNNFYKIFKTNFDTISLPKVHKGSQNKNLTTIQNCARSHIDIVKKAKCLNLPYVMIFEDDAYPCIDVYNKMQKYLNFIPNNARLILLGWSNHSKRKEQKFDYFINPITTLISGAHAYIIFKSAYDAYINFFSNRPTATADCAIFSSLGHSYVLDKPLFIQYSKNKSMNKHIGYIFYGDHDTPPEGFETIDKYKLS